MKQLMPTQHKGFSLVIVLLLVSVLAGFLTGIVSNNKNKSTRNEAEIAGWEAAKIARAARIFARDALVSDPNLAQSLAVSPNDISINSLISLGMLPNNFARENGGEYFNAVGQQIRVILANHPIDGDPNDVTTVPTAYVYFANSAKSSGSIIQDIVQEARREGVAVSAPIYSAGVNLSGDCNGRGDAVIIWDTGCMSDSEFELLTGDVYAEGSFVVPSWRSVNFDSRALMRFPQPENAGLPTMLTELEMGDPNDCDVDPSQYITILSDDPSASQSGICSAISDDPTLHTDRRRDILNTNNISSNSYIANPQSGDDVSYDSNGIESIRVNESYALNISGSLDSGGDTKIYDGDIIISGDLTADKNINVVNSSIGDPVSAVIGSINAGRSTSNNIIVEDELNISGDISVQNGLQINGSATISEALVTGQLQMTGAGATTINVAENANMLGITTLENAAISGVGATGLYSYVTGELNMTNANVSGSINTNQSISFLGSVDAGTVNVTNGGGGAQCLGDCPRRSLDEFCRNITGMTYDECMANF